jgi:peptidoglycan/LPS O-acetylase OafA/YrhL
VQRLMFSKKMHNLGLKMEIKNHRYIDSLRGWAILGVILVHSGQSAPPVNLNLLWIFGNSATGVQLFYVVSALTLCMSWNVRFGHEKFLVRTFFVRRFFRVAPMFWISIVLYLVIDGFGGRYWAPDGIKWWTVLTTVFFVHGFHPETINSVVPGGWSIAVEATFYAIFPFVIQRIRSYSTLLLLFIPSLVFANNQLIVATIFTYPADKNYLVSNFAFLNFSGQLPVFLIGMFCYQFIKSESRQSNLGLLSGAGILALCLEYISPTVTRGLIPSHVVAACVFAIVTIYLSIYPLKIFVNKVTIRLGKLSYSMYLLHFLVLHYFKKFGISARFQNSDVGSLLHFVLVVLITVIVANLSYVLIEKPGIKFGYWCTQKISNKSNLGGQLLGTINK